MKQLKDNLLNRIYKMEIANNRKPKDYQNGKIYSIRSYQTDLIYIGSTTQPLSKRLSKHRQDFNSWENNKFNYITSFEIIKFNDHYIELIENYSCNSKNELERREGQLIRETANAVNKRIAGLTRVETCKLYYDTNKEHISEYKKQWYEKNKEKCDCECGGKYTYCNKSTHIKTNKHQKYINEKQLKDNATI